MSDWKSPFDDDNHTLHDGALPRFFRMRKWFFAVGFALLLLDTGWWDYSATMAALKLSIPANYVRIALTLSGSYLIVQGLLVGYQIWGTYGDSLNARARLINLGQLSELREAADRMEREVQSSGVSQADIKARIAEMEYDESHKVDDHRSPADEPKPHSSARIRVARDQMKERVSDAASTMMTVYALRRRAESLQSTDATRAIMRTEMMLDGMRIFPTLLFLIYGVIAHGRLS